MKIEDLNLPPDAGPGGRDELKINQQRVDRFLEKLEELIEDQRFLFAYDTIASIKAMVETTNRVTEGQETAIRNIEVGVDRRESRGPGWGRRRYEGWGG